MKLNKTDAINASARLRLIRSVSRPTLCMIYLRQILFLVVGMSAAAGSFVGCSSCPPTTGRHPSISVTASTRGDFAKGYSWHLAVTSEQKARLTIDTYPKASTREFDISTEQISQLVDALERERFFSLRADYGEIVPDGSADTIKIVKDGVAHTVSIHFLMNWVHSDPAKLKEPARAVRVFNVVRGWFDDKDAVDLKKYDDMVLEAAGKAG
jgi:hypothetical protein